MATNLIVRNVDEEVTLALKQLAASYGHGAKAEHREILKAAFQRRRRRAFLQVLAEMLNIRADADFGSRKTVRN